MATIQRGTTKVANKLLSYAEKRAEERSGVDCPHEYAKAQFKATRDLWGKNEGVQAHHVIQSFSPGEVDAKTANEIGRELAKEIAKGHEAVIYTHTDKDHIHNHIVINAVSYEDGHKYHASNESLYRIREVNDRLCRERGLSIVEEKTAPVRYTLAEKALIEKGKDSWKEEIRDAIDFQRTQSKTYEEFKADLTEKFGIEVKERGKHITFAHPDNGRKVRGFNLGNSYDKETLKNGFEREIERSTDGNQRGIKRDDTGRGKGGDVTSTANGLSGIEEDISRRLQFAKFALGQKRPTQEPIRTDEQRNDGGSQKESGTISNSLEKNTGKELSNTGAISKDSGAQRSVEKKIDRTEQPSITGSQKPSRQSSSKELGGNDKSIGSSNRASAIQGTGEKVDKQRKTPDVRDSISLERDRFSDSQSSVGADSDKLKEKSKFPPRPTRERDSGFER
ncbi:relaxase/mobilization nuclease domain-containing protein [Priestia flexa]|uniref:relaxase/mobilization nuclease domain-containing protein n=1 Tax=Priestia flexa TaxID=86664 RepID=UPI0024933CE3|nr:relaxase/mobilization nuclease domain-containing protein [Priestia flexa]